MTDIASSSRWQRLAPALTLIVLSPTVAEVLPGATDCSFPRPSNRCRLQKRAKGPK
jgi:hypothetical protein